MVLYFSRTRRESKSRYWASNENHFFCFVVRFAANSFWQGFWTWGSGYPPRCPYSAVSKEMQAGRQAGSVGGQATQPGSTRTPSPSVQPGCITPPGSGATMASRHRLKGQTVKLRGNPEGQ